MYIFEMPTKVTTLSKGLLAFRTSEGTLTCMLSKMITQVAAFFEDGTASAMSALEIQLDTHGLMITDFNGLVPVAGYALKRLRFRARRGVTLLRCHFLTLNNVVH